MDRRTFLNAVASGAGTLLVSPLSAAPVEGIAEQQKPVGASPAAYQDYYEFSPDGTECVIKRPDTPMPWMNLLNNDVFQAWITQRGYHECLMGDRGLNGLTNPQEQSGNLYVRDADTGKYFSMNHPPAGANWDCRQGLGYTTLHASHLGLSATARYFVPRNDNALVWVIDIQNESARARNVDIFSTVEWSLGDQYKQQLFQGHGGGGDPWTGGSQFNLYKKVWREGQVLYAMQNAWRTLGVQFKPWAYTGFFASSLPLASFDTQESEFIGHARTVNNPVAVEKGKCTNTPFWSQNDYPWGVLHNRLAVGTKGRQTLVLVLGMARQKTEIAILVRKYSKPEAAAEEFARVQDYWRTFLAKSVNVQTPEKEIDRTVNIWSKYQWRSSMMKGPNTGRRGLAIWSYGLMGSAMGTGTREVICQPHDADVMRESTLRRMQLQQAEPQAQLAVGEPLLPATDLGAPWPPAPSRGPFPLPNGHEVSNVYPIADYIKETGDLAILDVVVPYVGGGQGTVFEHVQKSVEYVLTGLSARRLPQMCAGLGDWNDELNMISRQGRGESIMQAMETCHMLRECSDLARLYGRPQVAESWMQKYEEIKNAVNSLAWDGEWYVRGFADGQAELVPVGTHRDKEGRIYLNSQSWAVISGVADRERGRLAMESVRKHLVSDYGPMILAPPYSAVDRHVGLQSAYAPGWRNGCIYPRPAGWAIMAACLADMPDLAFDMYKKTSLSERSKDVELYASEPYVYSENYVGPPHRLAGRAQYQWCVGEGANWMWHSYVYYILGIRPVLNGLLVDPKIPAAWPGFKMTRQFRNAEYAVEVFNPAKTGMGVQSIIVDGREIKGNIIAPHADGKTHAVKVVLA